MTPDICLNSVVIGASACCSTWACVDNNVSVLYQAGSEPFFISNPSNPEQAADCGEHGEQVTPTCYLKNMGGSLCKNIILLTAMFLYGCFVLFNGGGTRGSIQGFKGQPVGGRGRLTNDKQSVSVSLSKGLIDELWSGDADKQEVPFSHLNVSRHGKAVYCMS